MADERFRGKEKKRVANDSNLFHFFFPLSAKQSSPGTAIRANSSEGKQKRYLPFQKPPYVFISDPSRGSTHVLVHKIEVRIKYDGGK